MFISPSSGICPEDSLDHKVGKTRGESTACEDRAETGSGEDSGDLFALVTLDLDPAIFHGSASATGLLHFFGEPFLFGQSDPNEVRDDCDGFSAAPGGLATDINSPAVLAFCCRRTWWQTLVTQF